MQPNVILPPPADCIFMIDVMLLGAFCTQACQAAKSFAASDRRQFPGDAKHQRAFQRKQMQSKLRRNAEAATATTLASPVKIGLRPLIHGEDAQLTVDQGKLKKAVTGQAM